MRATSPTTGQFEFVAGPTFLWFHFWHMDFAHRTGLSRPTWTFKWWTYALGTLCLAMTALGVWALTYLLFPERPRAALAAGIFCALEWHLIWSAVSGMETVLFTALSLWLMVQINLPKFKTQNQGDDLAIGIWCGVLVLTRPEGLLLVGLVLLAQIGLRGWTRRATWASIVWTVIGMAIPLAPGWRSTGSQVERPSPTPSMPSSASTPSCWRRFHFPNDLPRYLHNHSSARKSCCCQGWLLQRGRWCTASENQKPGPRLCRSSGPPLTWRRTPCACPSPTSTGDTRSR